MPDYLIGSGRSALQKAGTTGFRDMGNTTTMTLAQEITTVEHFNSQSGTRKKDAEVVIEQELTISFNLDEPTSENLALFFMATTPTSATVASGSVTDEDVTARHDKWVKLANRNITSGTFVVNDDGGGGSYTEGTDYKVHYAGGFFMALSAGTISDAAALDIDYDHAGVTTQRIDAATLTTIEGEMYFIGDPASGRIIDVRAKVSIKPEGEMSLISQEWAEIGFEAECLLDPGNIVGLAEIIDRGTVTAA